MKRVFDQFLCGVLCVLMAVMGLVPMTASAQSASDIVLYATDASVKSGWNVVADSTAAGGARLANPNLGAAKLSAPLANPSNYFDLTFSAQAGTAYRLWIRAKAENNDWANDSVFVQFSGSVDASGSAVYRMGTTSATTINLEDCSGCGLSGWGWQDNGWGVGVMGPLIYFQTTGAQTLRVQVREDGISIDQIVLSPSTYVSASPGALKNDTTILSKTGATVPPSPTLTGSSDVVIWASDVPATNIWGKWSKVFDASAAGQTALNNPDAGAAKLSAPLANPTSYFDMTFNAQAGVPYHLWIRGKAQNDFWGNDSVFVQFSGSTDSTGAAVYRIGTTSGTTVNIEDGSGAGLSGWGWQDNGWGIGVMGPQIYFASTGAQTLRVQVREDGISIDQIVLSSQAYLNNSPGALKNDTVILPSTLGGSTQTPANQPPQVTISATPTSGTVPLAVNFTSNATDPDGYIASYSWSFGDGQTSTAVNPTNIYRSAGTYTARLTVTDNAGAQASVSTVITVTAPPTGSATLKVMSWNGQFGKGTDEIYSPDRQATWIANINPDLVAMCEIPSDLAPVLRDLVSQKTGRTWYYYHVPKYSGTTEGNLILSKYPFVSTSSRFLSYQRSVAQATINFGGKTINFFATHLDAYSSTYRAVEVSELTSWAAGFAESRIIAGDFNAGPDTSELSGMMSQYYDYWQVAMNAGVATAYPDNPVYMHTRTRRGRIDYVFYSRGASALTLRSAQIPDSRDLSNKNVVDLLGTPDDYGVRPSDHNMVVVTFDVR
ncbi:MAG TPA: endonuclease/exonuclease/phosphatase family protein [Blastocatellia bacterium]|nr:endonuclease/exonuclease/phosphatase family protein [Blastocatellia bacterium]